MELIHGEAGEQLRVLAVAADVARDAVSKGVHNGQRGSRGAPTSGAELLDLVVRCRGEDVTRFSTVVDRRNGAELQQVLVDAVHRTGGDLDALA